MDLEQTTKVVTVIVTYNGAEWIEKCLSSVVEAPVVDHKILVIDNGSQDATVTLIQNHFAQVQLLLPGENLGFGKANNMGIEIAMSQGADYIFLLNQDAWMNTNTFPELIRCMEKYPEFGILSPIQLNADGNLDNQFRKYYKAESNTQNQQVDEIKFVNASGWFMTAACIERVGGFSPLFFHYGEDADYCNRVRYHGFKIGVATKCSYIHDRGGRAAVVLTTEKQIQQMFVANLVRLANINRGLWLNTSLNFWRMSMNRLEGKGRTQVVTQAYAKSLKKLKEVVSHRKAAKQKGAFISY